ncbi:MAG: hypothetical protein NTW87_13545 [Planctomycetota bacterium]|nr:hypothetical protein [Planctomycetota bacterium]
MADQGSSSTVRRRTDGAASIVWAVLLLTPGLCRAGADTAAGAAPPTPEALAQAFETSPNEPWIVIREKGPFSRVLKAPGTATFDLRGQGTLSVCAARGKEGASIVRLRWVLHSRLGGMYIADVPQTVAIAGTVTVAVALDADSPDLVPVGHQRPWDDLAAAEVVAVELRAECVFAPAVPGAESTAITLSAASLEKGSAAAAKPSLVDLAAHPPPPGWRAKATLTFRIEPPPADPYAAEGDGDVQVVLPGGERALAFLEQPHSRAPDGSAQRSVAAGRPYWCAHLPELPASGTVQICSGRRTWRFPAEGLAFPGTPDRAPQEEASTGAAESGERWQPSLEVPLPANGAVWVGLPPSSLNRSGAWEAADQATLNGMKTAAKALWRPVPFWTAGWGGFGGPSRPNSALARHMDALLSRAAASGLAQPLVVLDAEMFGREGTFNWDSQPLNGRIAGPSELFRSREGVDFCRRWIRYCVARWGLARSVSALWLTPVLQTPGASEFHAGIAPLLSKWTRYLPVPVIALHPFARAPQTVKLLASFEPQEQCNWRVDRRLGPATAVAVPNAGTDGTSCQEVRAQDPSSTTIGIQDTYNFGVVDWRATPPDDFFAAHALQVDVWVPPTAPADLRLGVHVRDRDGLWFEALLPGMPLPGDWVTFALDITGANANGLKAINHRKDWTDYSRQRLTEIGLHVYSTHPNWTPPARAGTAATQKPQPVPLTARFDNIRAVRFPDTGRAPPTTISIVQSSDAATPAQLYRGDLWERHVTVNKTFANPFDATQCDLAAVITTPSGRQVRLPAFFDEPCQRREETPGGAEIVEPMGSEYFTVRYRAVESGPHKVTFELREGGSFDVVQRTWQPDSRFTPDGQAQEAGKDRWGRAAYVTRHPDGKRLVERIRFAPGPVTATLKLGGAALTVAAEPRPDKPFRGFLRVAADKRHFEYDDGTFFYPLGPALRSPSDSRIPYTDPKWNGAEISRLARRGTYQYDDYMAECGKAGVNWVRVWMCPWWCGLEWRRDWPGYQGCGRYNMLNAWRMDYLVEMAAQRNMVFELCVTNHGQYSLHVDTDWPNNPYKTALGGPLITASEFFTRADVKSALQNRLRYVIARYSHSPNIMAWGLLSEVEWLEEYEPSISSPIDRPAPNIEAWHTGVAEFMRTLDPNRHLATTHFARPLRGTGTLALPAIDYATSNAYSFFDEFGDGRYDASVALAEFWAGNKRGLRGFASYNKPALVTEHGRHWLGGQYSTRVQLDADLHTGLWGAVVQPLGGATGYWWWLHVHFDKRWGEYKAVAAFMQGEDMRPAKDEAPLEPVVLAVEAEGGVLRARALLSERRMYAWVYHQRAPYGEEVPTVSGGILRCSGLKPGNYSLEFWDTYEGRVVESRQLTVQAGDGKPVVLAVALPAVKRDLAIKVKPK